MNLLISEGPVNVIEYEKYLLRSEILREDSRKMGNQDEVLMQKVQVHVYIKGL